VRLCFLCFFCASVANAFSLDREAFTFTRYDLNVRVEPDQQRLEVRGKITLRNDSATPQKIAVLQISSSLDWRSIKVGDKPLQFVAQPYTSDIDHTGALSEAIVTLPEAVAPQGTVELEIGYEGVIVPDATRLTRIGTPEATGAARTGTRSGRNSRRCAERDTWRGIRSRPKQAIFPRATAYLTRWAGGRRERPPPPCIAGRSASDDESEKPELLVNATHVPDGARGATSVRCRLLLPISGIFRADVCDG
jgi:hypothetical protein